MQLKNPADTLTAQFDYSILERILENRHVVIQIAQAVLYCGRQGIALWGSAEKFACANGNHGNPGNLIALL